MPSVYGAEEYPPLTLWLCITFMHPLVAPGIAGYIAWQNFFLTYYMNRRSRLKG